MTHLLQLLRPRSYFCPHCGLEVIFRGNPPRMYHAGTSGWPCWKARTT